MLYNKKKEKALANLKEAEQTYERIRNLAESEAKSLYSLRKGCAVAIKNVERYLSLLANVPLLHEVEVAEVWASIQDFNRAVTFVKDHQSEETAMAIATTFGTASTDTAIVLLTNATLTNAIVASLDSETFSIDSFNMPSKRALGTSAGLLTLGGLLLLGGWLAFKNKEAAEKAEKILYEIKPKVAEIECKLQEVKNLYTETEKHLSCIDINEACKDFPKNYRDFSDDQKSRLGVLINSVKSMGELINRRVL